MPTGIGTYSHLRFVFVIADAALASVAVAEPCSAGHRGYFVLQSHDLDFPRNRDSRTIEQRSHFSGSTKVLSARPPGPTIPVVSQLEQGGQFCLAQAFIQAWVAITTDSLAAPLTGLPSFSWAARCQSFYRSLRASVVRVGMETQWARTVIRAATG